MDSWILKASISTIWLLYGVVIIVADIRSGDPISNWAYATLICSQIWAASML